MTDSLLAAFVGAIIAIVTSIIATWVSFRNIRTEYQTKYHLELVERQIKACESLWSVLAITSRTFGDQRLIIFNEKDAAISVECAQKLYSDLTVVFNSSSGLYFSKDLRRSLFVLRDFLGEEIITNKSDEQTLQWSKTKAKDLDGYIQNLRNAIRNEVGLVDLTVAKINRPG
jgi:hypothetical protein